MFSPLSFFAVTKTLQLNAASKLTSIYQEPALFNLFISFTFIPLVLLLGCGWRHSEAVKQSCGPRIETYPSHTTKRLLIGWSKHYAF